MRSAFRTEAGRRVVEHAYRSLLDAWPVACEQRLVSTREGETFVLVCGPADGPPLVLCHGSQANAASWLPDIAHWSSTFRVYAIDMIGEPGLSAPARPPLDSEAHALWLDDVLGGLGVQHASFVGVSLGGWLALDYAIRRPWRVKSLVLIASAGVGRQINFLARAWPLLFLGNWGRRKLMALVLGPPPKDVSAAEADLGEFLTLVMRHARPRVVKMPLATDAQLAALNLPILALLGAKDVLVDTAHARERLTALQPEATVVWLPEDGHFIRGKTDLSGDFLRATAP